MRKTYILLLIAVVFLAGCSMFGKGKKAGDGTDGQSLSEADLTAQREGRFAGGSIPLAEGEGMFRDVHFDYDSSSISDSARQQIESNIQALQSNPNLRVQLEGHSDERGTAEYNLALGNQRSRAVADVLHSFGVPASRISLISYGEEVPLDPGTNENAWAQNRRVHFSAHGGDQR